MWWSGVALDFEMNGRSGWLAVVQEVGQKLEVGGSLQFGINERERAAVAGG